MWEGTPCIDRYKDIFDQIWTSKKKNKHRISYSKMRQDREDGIGTGTVVPMIIDFVFVK